MKKKKNEKTQKRVKNICYIVPTLNSKIRTTVRVAQMAYWLMSLRGSLKKMARETIANAKPTFAANATLRGSDRPISYNCTSVLCKLFQKFAIPSDMDRKHRNSLVLPSRSSELPALGRLKSEKTFLGRSSLSLLFSAKHGSNLADIFVTGL